MSSSKTLHELCDELRVTRRVIQGYEKAGLVSATDKNKYGHLLYASVQTACMPVKDFSGNVERENGTIY